MKNIYLLFTTCLFSFGAMSQNVTIIESQTEASWAVQDTVWEDVANGMGLNPSIVPQSSLGLLSNFSSTDVIIVSSPTITLTPTYIQTLRDFVLNGGPVYIQAEYQTSFQGSMTFDSLMQAVGANFNWGSTISGSLVPMNIFGSLSTIPNNVSTLNYFHFGLTGSGSGVDPFLEYNGEYFGFCYIDTNSVNGTVITSSDADWAWRNASPALMENILTKLLDNVVLSLKDEVFENELLLYPNPTDGNFSVDLGKKYDHATITITDLTGRLIQSNEYNEIQFLNLKLEGPIGIYLLVIESGNKKTVIRLAKK